MSKNFYSAWLTFFICVSASSLANAYQIPPNPSFSTITIDYAPDGDSAVNYLIPYDNFGALILNAGGQLTNYGDLNNYNNISILTDGYLENRYNSYYNSGNLNNYSLLQVEFNGNVDGDGSLNNYDYGSIYNSGIVRASEINNSALGLIYSDNRMFADNLNNSGYIENHWGTISGSKFLQDGGWTSNNGDIVFSSIEILGGTLSGIGTLTGAVTIGSGATIIPGNSPGTLGVIGDFHSSGDYVFEIAGLSSGLYDVLDITGNAFFTGGNFHFDFIDGFYPSVGDHWDFLLADTVNGLDTVNFIFDDLDKGLGVRLDSTSGNLSLTFVTVVPEPGTYAMLIAGLGLVCFMAYRRKPKEEAT